MSKIIKAEQPGSDRVSPLQTEDFVEVCGDQTFLHEAMKDGEDINSSEERERDGGLEEKDKKNIEDAYSEGVKVGLEMGTKELEPVISCFMESIKELSSLKESLYKDSEFEIAELVLAAARKIIKTEIEIDRNSVAAVIKSALMMLTDKTDLIIRVNPYDYAHILEDRKVFSSYVGDLKDITFIEDETVGRGGCVIESTFGEIDARIEEQLEQLGNALKGAYER